MVPVYLSWLPRTLAGSLGAICVGFLSACSAPLHTDSEKSENTITIIALNNNNVAVANQSTYTPRKLSPEFYQTASHGNFRGAGALPTPPTLSTGTPEIPALTLPKPEARQPYRLGVGDIVEITAKSPESPLDPLTGLFSRQKAKTAYAIRDDGSISIPELGMLQLNGKTLTEAEDVLFDALVERQFTPSFSLDVSEYNAQKLVVGGAVKSEKVLAIKSTPPTLAEAIASAGGPTKETTEFGVIRLFRQGEFYQIPLVDFKKRADIQGLLLKNGDAIYVDTTFDIERAWTFYEQQVENILVRSRARESALRALRDQVEIHRNALDERREIFAARHSLGAEQQDFVYLTGKNQSQSRFALPYERHAVLADVIFQEAAPREEAEDKREVYVLRARAPGSNHITAYHLSLRNSVNLLLATQFQMRPNDIVLIENRPLLSFQKRNLFSGALKPNQSNK